MRGVIRAFNGLVRTLIVRHGESVKLKNGGRNVNFFTAVYGEMFLQICRDYPGLPDARKLKAHEILFFYNGLRPELSKHTKG